MKIVIGGASSVGKSLVGSLSLGNNDIVVVAEDAEKLDEIAREYDIQPVLGSISNPDIQEAVEMKKADMLIAVTENDEVNLVACQVAYTLFGVPRKIARVDSQYFLNPLWNKLYNEKSLPVDLVITPDIEIAEVLQGLFKLPGSTAVYPFFSGKLNVFSFRQRDTDIPFMKFSLSHINNKLAELSAAVVMILRGNHRILPKDEDIYLQRNDLIYIACLPEHNIEVMRLFGVDHNPYEKVVLFGANAISYYLAKQLEEDENILNCSIVENDVKKARKLAEKLNKASVIVGEMMSDKILEDVGFSQSDISIAVTEKDKDNLLLSLLASKNKDTQAVSLINSREYNLLANNIRNNTLIDRSVITVSGILQYLRRARINEAYALGREMGEIWEIRLGEDSSNIDRDIEDLQISDNSAVMAVEHNGEYLYNPKKYRLCAEDMLIIYVSPVDIKNIERIFYR